MEIKSIKSNENNFENLCIQTMKQRAYRKTYMPVRTSPFFTLSFESDHSKQTVQIT